MKLNDFLVMATLVGGAATAVSAADIKGKVTLKGTPPPEPALAQKTAALIADPNCGKVSQGPKNRVYVVGQNGELGQAIVKITEGVTGAHAPSAEPAVLDQKG